MVSNPYIPFLLGAQNSDGGWGYRAGTASGTEPTSWAVLALLAVVASKNGFSIFDCPLPTTDVRSSKLETRDSQSTVVPSGTDEFRLSNIDSRLPQSAISQAANAGIRWLRDAQLPEGAWPAFVGQRQGCWVTAPACLALHAWSSAGQFSKVSGLPAQASESGGYQLQGRDSSLVTRPSPLHESSDRVGRGLRWLYRTWPAEGNLWWRLRRRFRKQSIVVRQDSSLRGWSWTPGTASWVEPTSYALIAFNHIPEELHPRRVSRRLDLGVKMLYDRMCPGGGWNSGNPLVYGVAGEPRVGPTVWALLALQTYRDRPENRKSVDWLEQVYSHIRGPASLALAHLCLEAYGRPVLALEPVLSDLWLKNQFFGNVLVAAWVAIALSSEL